MDFNTPQEVCDIPLSSSAVRLPAFGISRSITNFGILELSSGQPTRPAFWIHLVF